MRAFISKLLRSSPCMWAPQQDLTMCHFFVFVANGSTSCDSHLCAARPTGCSGLPCCSTGDRCPSHCCGPSLGFVKYNIRCRVRLVSMSLCMHVCFVNFQQQQPVASTTTLIVNNGVTSNMYVSHSLFCFLWAVVFLLSDRSSIFRLTFINDRPVVTTCPNCHQTVTTVTQYQFGIAAILVVVIFFFVFWFVDHHFCFLSRLL